MTDLTQLIDDLRARTGMPLADIYQTLATFAGSTVATVPDAVFERVLADSFEFSWDEAQACDMSDEIKRGKLQLRTVTCAIAFERIDTKTIDRVIEVSFRGYKKTHGPHCNAHLMVRMADVMAAPYEGDDKVTHKISLLVMATDDTERD